MAYNIKLMVKVAKLYFNNKLPQLEIARKLKISKYQVTRLLKMAEKMRIVKIIISDPTLNVTSLEERLEEGFNLKRAIVVENKGLSVDEIRSKIGVEAARYLLEIIKDDDIIGISWGGTVNEVVNNLPSEINRKVKIIQIIGASHQLSIKLSAHDLAKRFGAKFNVEPLLLFAPAVVINKKTRDLFLEDVSIKKVFDYFNKINLAIFGVGTLRSEPFLESEYLSKDDIESLKESKTVGDVIGNHYDIDGNPSDTTLKSRTIAISLEQLKEIPYTIAVAGGEEKAEAILGALRGKYINILVTDSKAAEKILQIDKK
ncbi:MAG: sugar-binding transcriptional regulator [Actinobacteria bacterium]|nr:sugar-binding transcriptional regulator [Actinomycetota bacterium]